MAVKVSIPSPLQQYTEDRDTVEIEAATVAEALRRLAERYDGLRKHLFGDDGQLRRFVNVYVNDEDIRFLQKGNTALQPNDVLAIIPSVAGGGEPGRAMRSRDFC